MTRARASGWTLTEILVFVAVIGLIASIAIPIALRTRRSDPDPDASATRAVRTVQQDYNGSRRGPAPTPPPAAATTAADGLVKLVSREMTSSLR
jgi:type II secretory pathway pseudopilin PulG